MAASWLVLAGGEAAGLADAAAGAAPAAAAAALVSSRLLRRSLFVLRVCAAGSACFAAALLPVAPRSVRAAAGERSRDRRGAEPS